MKEAHKLGDTFVFLSDPHGSSARRYAGLYAGGPVLQPATFVIGKDQKIDYAFIDENYRVRAAADEVLKAVRQARAKLGSGSKSRATNHT